jgi:hypothetical protein
VADPKVSSSNEAKKSTEKQNENTEPLPPIKLKFRLGGNSHPVVANQSNSTANNESITVISVETEQTGDAWDDFCYICNGNFFHLKKHFRFLEGCDDKSGDLGCCASCPRVFHQFCHIPICNKPMQELPDDWICGLCIRLEPIREPIEGFPEQAKLVSC